MKTRKMARLTTLGFLGSIALHGAAYASLGLAPKRGAEGRPPASVMFEVEEPAPKVAEPEPEPPPPPPAQEEKVAVARPAAAPPPPAAAPPPPQAAAPVDLSGLTVVEHFRFGGQPDYLKLPWSKVRDFQLRQMGEAGYAMEVHADLPPEEEARVRALQKFTSPPGTLLFEVPVNWLPVRDQWIGDILRDIAARGRQRA